MKLEIKEKSKGDDSVTLLLSGELTIYSVEPLRERLLAGLNRCASLSVDLSDVVKIDTAGFQLLVAAGKEPGKKFSLLTPGPDVEELFSLYGEKM